MNRVISIRMFYLQIRLIFNSLGIFAIFFLVWLLFLDCIIIGLIHCLTIIGSRDDVDGRHQLSLTCLNIKALKVFNCILLSYFDQLYQYINI